METQDINQFEKVESNYPIAKRYCCLIFFIFLSLTLLSAAILLILFVLKPKKPVFHLHSIHLNAFKLNVTSAKEISVSCSMASLIFITQNPNKFGIKYSSSEFGVLYEKVPVGTVDIPKFYQPAHGTNVTVMMYVSIQQFNLSDLINGTHVEVQILGCMGVQPHVLNFPLARIKVSLDCRIGFDYGIVTLSKGIESIKRHKALLLNNFPHLSQKCSLSLL